jgi:hypothetical protein
VGWPLPQHPQHPFVRTPPQVHAISPDAFDARGAEIIRRDSEPANAARKDPIESNVRNLSECREVAQKPLSAPGTPSPIESTRLASYSETAQTARKGARAEAAIHWASRGQLAIHPFAASDSICHKRERMAAGDEGRE